MLIVDAVSPLMAALPPFLLILSVYFIGLMLTEVPVEQRGGGDLYTPIAIELAQHWALIRGPSWWR